jgi:formylglycine-generating enzyme required for sulfatase activity
MRTTTLLMTLCLALMGHAQVVLPKKTSQNIKAVDALPGVMIDVAEVTLGDWFAYVYARHQDIRDYEITKTLAPLRTKVPAQLQDTYDKMIEQVELNIFGSKTMITTNSQQELRIPLGSSKILSDLNHPVTGISFDQVHEYLKWREELLSFDKTVVSSGLRVKARLITPMEWNKISRRGNMKEGYTYPDSVNSKGCLLMHVRPKTICDAQLSMKDKLGKCTVPVGTYPADGNDLYDLYGNAAEMTSIKGLSKGGSFMHWASDGYGRTLTYSEPEEWVGFRVVFEFEKR